MTTPEFIPGQDDDEALIEHSEASTSAGGSGEVDGEAPLCLRVANNVFPIYALSELDFAIALSDRNRLANPEPPNPPHGLEEYSSGDPQSTMEERCDQCIAGHLFTENGEVSIPVSFYLDREQGPLLVCVFDQLSMESSRVLRDLVELLTNDWDDEQEEHDEGEVDPKPPTLKPEFESIERASISSTPLVTATETVVANPTVVANQRANAAAVASPVFKRRKSSLGKLVLAAFGFAAVVAFFGSRILTGDRGEQEQANAQSVTTVPLASPDASQTSEPDASQTSVVSPSVEAPSIRGKIVAQQTILRSPKAGIVAAVLVKAGQVVEVDQAIVTLISDIDNAGHRRLTSELKLAQTELLAAETRLAEGNKRMHLAQQKLAESLLVMQQELSAAENELQLASKQWQDIEPLVERDNVGRKEVEQVKQALSKAQSSYSSLQSAIAMSNKTLKSADLEERLGNELGISIPSLEADLSVAKARVLYLQEQIELSATTTLAATVSSFQSGVITKLMVSEGTRVAAEQAICEIQDPVKRLVELQVPASLAAAYQTETTLALRLADSDVKLTATVEDVQDQIGSAKIDNPESLLSGSQNLVTLRLALAPNLHTLPLGTIVVLDTRPQ